MAGQDNRLVIEGVLQGAPEVRHTPAGISLARFVLEHHSRQRIAGHEREMSCEVPVIASGEALTGVLAGVVPGSVIRVSGCLARASHRRTQLVLHANAIEIF